MLLAGGRAKRLGGIDKPGLELGGRALVERVAGAVANASRLVLVGPARPRLSRAIVVREQPPGSGPVPALVAGLAYVEARWVAVLAADLPFLTRAHVDELRAAAVGHPGAVMLDGTGREQWLTGVWRTGVLRAAVETYDGASLRGLLGPLRPKRLALRVPPDVPPPWLDCDTIGDVTTAKGWL